MRRHPLLLLGAGERDEDQLRARALNVLHDACILLVSERRKRLKRLCRCIARPALSGERVQLDAAGQVELKPKTRWRDGTTHLVMSQLASMQRLAHRFSCCDFAVLCEEVQCMTPA